MSKFKAYGNWVAVKTVFREEHISEAGVLYKDDLPDHMMTWSEVVSIGPDVREDILSGDLVYWKYGADPGCFYKSGDEALDLVQEHNLLAVKRPEKSYREQYETE